MAQRCRCPPSRFSLRTGSQRSLWGSTLSRNGSVTMLGLASERNRVPELSLEEMGGVPFATVLADPPWRFANRTGKVAPEHRRLSRYDTWTPRT